MLGWLGLYLSLLSTPARAHDAHIATFELQGQGAVWVMQASFPRVAVDTALRRRLGDAAVESWSELEYEAAVIGYLKMTVHVQVDGAPVDLGAGGIELGEHETDVRLILRGVPTQARSMDIKIDSFAEGQDQYNVLRVLRLANGTEQVYDRRVLSPDYGYEERVSLP